MEKVNNYILVDSDSNIKYEDYVTGV